MVILYAARHRLPVPGLARWLLALGIVATLAANVAHGWPDGPVGAVVAAWPAASLVGSYELLLWLIRTSAAMVRGQSPAHGGDPARHPAADLRLLEVSAAHSSGGGSAPGGSVVTGALDGRCMAAGVDLDRISVPRWPGPDGAYQPAGQQEADRSAPEAPVRAGDGEDEVNTAAVAAYRASLESGTPLSERKLAAMFGKTSRRWARNRMAEAHRVPVYAMAEP
jgi:hypothetical protein